MIIIIICFKLFKLGPNWLSEFQSNCLLEMSLFNRLLKLLWPSWSRTCRRELQVASGVSSNHFVKTFAQRSTTLLWSLSIWLTRLGGSKSISARPCQREAAWGMTCFLSCFIVGLESRAVNGREEIGTLSLIRKAVCVIKQQFQL